jgi:hypothetical protein
MTNDKQQTTNDKWHTKGEKQEEHVVIFRHGELLSGVMDKNAVGNVSLGVVHAGSYI